MMNSRSKAEAIEKILLLSTVLFQVLFMIGFLLKTNGGQVAYPLWENIGTEDQPYLMYNVMQYDASKLLILAVVVVILIEVIITFYGIKQKTYLGVAASSAGMLLYFGMFVQVFYNGGNNLKKHILFAVVGFAVMWITYYFIRVKMNDKRGKVLRYTLIALILTNLMIIIVGVIKAKITGESGGVNGSYAWFELGPISFQIGEFLKICIILLSGDAFRSRRDKKMTLTFLGLCAASVAVLVLARDLGNAVVLLIVCMVSSFFLFKHWWPTVATSVAALLAVLWAGKHISYVKLRFDACFHALDSGSGQQYKSLIAIVKNGLKGASPSGDVVSVTEVVSSSTDMVFNVLFGIYGIFVVLLLSAFLIVLLYQMMMTPIISPFHYMIAVLSVTVFFSQYVIHAGGNLNIIPFTGICCNFISLGGSNMIVSFMMLANIMACLSPQLESAFYRGILPEGVTRTIKRLAATYM